MPELKMTAEEGRAIVFEDNEDFETVSDEVYETSRWSLHREIIVQRMSDNTYWRGYYSVGKTEQQMERPYDHDDEAVFAQVEQKEVVSTVWVVVED